MAEKAKRAGGRPEREDGPDYRTVGAKIPGSLAQLVKEPVGTPDYPTLKARVVTLLRNGLESYAQGPNRLGVIYTGDRKYIGPVDLPQPLGDQFMALVSTEDVPADFPSITACMIELLHRGLAREQERSADLPVQPELPLAPTGT
ncbi:hypothetical protein [Nocardia sp. XZ_19_369]|uniref:hypothetical protein n=1 Tax=Nocardia sp. XZ_19_369 TaxID=2769487 RepID=UPI0018903F03|nr:hypothetical protein [Nocardia sp. XZ_19_369]